MVRQSAARTSAPVSGEDGYALMLLYVRNRCTVDSSFCVVVANSGDRHIARLRCYETIVHASIFSS